MTAKKKKRLVSGKRSTGELHLGHYFGAVKNWIELQDKYECFFFAADWHALTTDYKDPSLISVTAKNNIADWLSLGLDPKKSTIFVQSHVKEHAELYLLLSMITPLGWLERNPTYKEQIKQIKNKDLSNLGFLGYPVLQTADVLAYKGEVVPVGQDQVSHLELGREITRRFNKFYGSVFKEAQHVLSPTPKIPGTDGRKMSNSYGNAIFLSDTKEQVSKKAMTMVTDPARKRRSDPGDPAKCPLFSLHELYSPKPVISEVVTGCKSAKIGCVDCKKTLLESLLPWHKKVAQKRKGFQDNPKLINEVIEAGAIKAQKEAAATLKDVKAALKL